MDFGSSDALNLLFDCLFTVRGWFVKSQAKAEGAAMIIGETADVAADVALVDPPALTAVTVAVTVFPTSPLTGV